MKWFGPLRWPISKLCGPLSVWAMKSVECVPVYRHKPRELTTTFRKSVEAMQAGDNLLIFPENPDADPNRPGYEHGRPGELFRGFTMLAQVYYARTGKCCRFVPMLAHKGMRTLSFGTEIDYDPEKHPIEERDRVVEEAQRQMWEMFDREEKTISGEKSEGKEEVRKRAQAGQPKGSRDNVPCRVKGRRPLGFGATPQLFHVRPFQRKNQQRCRQRSVPASNFALPQERPQAALSNLPHIVAPNGRDHIVDLATIVALFPQAGDFAPAGATKGHENR